MPHATKDLVAIFRMGSIVEVADWHLAIETRHNND